MTERERFERSAELFRRARELGPPDRAALLDAECAGDDGLRAEVEHLLAAETAPMPFASLAGELRDLTESLDAPPGTAEAPGDTVGPYTLIRKLGEGGFGVVYEATQTEPLRRTVALKIIKLGMDTRQVIARFEAERRALAMMDHPNIARVLDAGATDSGRPYFVMELVEGSPITGYCDEHSLSTDQRLRLFTRVCQAVQHAHQKGLIHRDIKPSNVMVTTVDGQPMPKVIDFGIAKATDAERAGQTAFTQAGQLIGTPEYMSPEQAGAAPDIDTRTDVYALGVLLYELLTGTTPFESRRLRSAAFAEVQRIIREENPPKPSTRLHSLGATAGDVARARGTEASRLAGSIRGDLDWIVMRALEKQRERRYDSPGALADDIARRLEHRPVEACPPDLSYRARTFARRHRVGLAITGVGLLGVAATLAVLAVGLVRTSHQRDIAIAAQNAEREARRHADELRDEAVTAQQAEQVARERAENALGEAQAVGDFLDSMLTSLRPEEEGRDVLVREVLDAAAERIGDEFPDRPEVEARLRYTIGGSYLSLGLRAAAEPHYLRALELDRREFGDDSPRAMDGQFSLGELYRQMGRYDEAEQLIRSADEWRHEHLGPDDPDTVYADSSLAAVLTDTNRFDEAIPLLESTYQRLVEIGGEDTEEALTCLNNLGVAWANQLRYDKALPYYEKSYEGRAKHFGPGHPDTILALVNLGSCYGNVGRPDDAERVLLRAIEDGTESLGEEHPHVLMAMSNLAVLYQQTKRPELAIPMLTRALAIQRRLEGAEHPATIAMMNTLAGLHQQLGHNDEADAIIAEAVSIAERVFGPDDWRTGLMLVKQGIGYQRAERFEDAESVLLRAHTNIEGALGPDEKFTHQAERALTNLYDAWGKPDEAAAWRAKIPTEVP